MVGGDLKEQIQHFWNTHPCGVKFSEEQVGSKAFFRGIEHHRYGLEPHILKMAPFQDAQEKKVLELGCGIGTDGVQFARNEAWYVGTDLTNSAVQISQRHFEVEGLNGNFVNLDAERLPFHNEVFDLIYSHGVLHHTPDTQSAFDEVFRILKPGGKAVIMVYHRRSYNYYVNIQILRRLGVRLLYFPWGPGLVHRLTGEARERLEEHQEMLRQQGPKYLEPHAFLSQNTDGPGNPLSKVYTRRQLRNMFGQFSHVETAVRFLRRDRIPLVGRFIPVWLDRVLGRVWGWHLYAIAEK